MKTSKGWWSFNFSDGVEAAAPTGYRRDSRLEFIFEGDRVPDLDELEDALRGLSA